MYYKFYFLVALLLSGCASRDFDSHKYVSIEHLKATDFDGNADLDFPGYSNIRSKVIAGTAISVTELNNYFYEGLMLTKTHCLNSIISVVEQSHDNSYTKEQYLLGTVLATGLMGINGASSDSFERLALASAFLIGSSELYQNYYLMGPNAKDVLLLLEKALDAQYEYTTSSAPSSFTDAANRIYDYATICSSVKIDQMVADAMSAAKFVVPKEQSHLLLLIQKVSEVLGGVIVTENNIYGLYHVVKNGNSAASIASVSNFISGLTYTAQFNELQAVFLSQPPAVINALDTGSSALIAAPLAPVNNLLNIPVKSGGTVHIKRD